jgi:hypothetical protein
MKPSSIVITLLFAIVALEFLIDARDIAYPLNDFVPAWTSAVLYASGRNPYAPVDPATGHDLFEQITKPSWPWSATRNPSTGCINYDCITGLYPSLYPVSALALFVPLTFLTWQSALAMFLFCSVAVWVGGILVLARSIGSRIARMLFVAYALAIAPTHTGIHQANPNTLVIGLVFLVVGLAGTNPDIAGIALALAMCVKPQIAGLFLLLLCLRRCWRAAITACVTAGAIVVSAVVWASMHGIAWVSDYAAEMKKLSQPGSVNNFDFPGAGKFQLLNLQVLVYTLTHNIRLSNLITWAAFTCMVVVALWLLRSRDAGLSDGAAITAILTLIPAYQRIYSAAILVLVIYWAVKHLPEISAKACLLLMAPLLVPGVNLLSTARVQSWAMAHSLGSSWIWNGVVMPHVTWIEIGLFAILCFHLTTRKPRAESRVLPVAESRA